MFYMEINHLAHAQAKLLTVTLRGYLALCLKHRDSWLAVGATNMQVTHLIAAILEETDQQNGHDNNDGNEDGRIDQGKTKRLNTARRGALIKRKIESEV